MGLFDQLVQQVLGQDVQTGSQGQTAGLVQAVISMLGNEQSGGIQGLAQLFQEKGLGEIVSSWISTGENKPISPDQVVDTLGADQVAALSREAGIPVVHGANALALVLPALIDQLTPKGQVPQGTQLVQAGLHLLKNIC